MKQNWFLYFLLIFFPLGQFGRLWNGNGITILLNDVIVALCVVTWFVVKTVKKEKINFPPLTKFILLFFASAIFSLLINTVNFSLKELLVAILYLLRWIFYAAIYFVLINEKVEKKVVINGLILVGFTTALIGLTQYLLFPDLSFLSIYQWDPHVFRLTAPFLDPTFTGAVLTLALILLISLNFGKKISLKKLLTGVIIYIALAFTYSRGAYGMYLLGMGSIAFFKKSLKFFIVVLLVGTITLAILPKEKSYGTNLERSETIEARLENWQHTLKIWTDHPIFGVGFNTYRYAQKKYGFLKESYWEKSHAGGSADSSLLFIGATTGVIGLLSFIALSFKLLRNSFLQIKNPLAIALFASLLGLFGHSFFANSLFYPWIMEWIWILVALENIKENK